MKSKSFIERYQSKDTPWDIGKPDFNLIAFVEKRNVPLGRVLDIGCGTGDNTIWLAKRATCVTGIDVSDIAVEEALKKAREKKMDITLGVGDFLTTPLEHAPFDFAFDRGCFHSYDSDEERITFAEKVAFYLSENGVWLTLLGSADDPPRDHGPPKRSARDIAVAVEPFFEIVSLTKSVFETKFPENPGIWVCHLKKRSQRKTA